MFYQPTLLGGLEPAIPGPPDVTRRWLDATSWVDHQSEWLAGAGALFEALLDLLPWRQRTGVPMYDRLVDEPRLTAWWSEHRGRPEPLPILAEARRALGERYAVHFDSIGFNLYRDGADSVAWHGDRHRRHVTDPVVAILSVGGRRPFLLRPSGGGPSTRFDLGEGDLLVMGGACQHDWQHCVPKVRSAQPRLSITFRHGAEAPRARSHHDAGVQPSRRVER